MTTTRFGWRDAPSEVEKVSGDEAVAIAIAFVWFGMVVAISFVETPLKFRAPDVTLRVGLGIGRLVFRALNTVEAMFAVAIVITLVVGDSPTASAVSAVVAVASLVVQLVVVRPGLTRRSDAVLAGEVAPRTRSHHAYIALELVKVVALLVAGITLLAHAA
jgi:hypothetical protein